MTSYSRSVGKKFNQDGTARQFPGNTIICHIPKTSIQFELLTEIRNSLKSESWGDKFSFLPPSSFHMTIFEGICDQIRKSSHWFTSLPLDTPIEETDLFLKETWRDIEKPGNFKMKARFILMLGNITIGLIPFDEKEEKKLRNFRDLMSEKTGLRQPNHLRYGFHISLAYNIIKPSFIDRIKILKKTIEINKMLNERFGTLELNTPELTFFEDMTNFAPSRESAIRNCEI